RKTASDKIYCEDWNIELKVPSCRDDISYVGIRAHYIEPVKDCAENAFNTYEFIVENIIENPFNLTIYVKALNNEHSSMITFFMEKNRLYFKIGDKINLHFPYDKLFVF
ncbi:MAG: ABC transporter, partial [Clostridium sp.]